MATTCPWADLGSVCPFSPVTCNMLIPLWLLQGRLSAACTPLTASLPSRCRFLGLPLSLGPDQGVSLLPKGLHSQDNSPQTQSPVRAETLPGQGTDSGGGAVAAMSILGRSLGSASSLEGSAPPAPRLEVSAELFSTSQRLLSLCSSQLLYMHFLTLQNI